MTDIFVAYSHTDLVKALALTEILQGQGWTVFTDRQAKPGDRWDKEIEKQLHAARVVVVLWSEKSRNSQYVLEEAEHGKNNEILFPALIESVSIPYGFGRIQTANLIEWEPSHGEHRELNCLVEAIRVRLSASSAELGFDTSVSIKHLQDHNAPQIAFSSAQKKLIIGAVIVVLAVAIAYDQILRGLWKQSTNEGGAPFALITNFKIGKDFQVYSGMCDASAAVSLEREHFVVADDESNVLLIYRRGQSHPVNQLSLEKFLATPGSKESDIEGATRIAGRIYWITSHANSGAGLRLEGRHRIFATDIVTDASPPEIKPTGLPYAKLVDDLIASDKLKELNFSRVSRLSPQEGGLNIEGLANTSDGKLLLGFRSPLVDGHALIIPIENPRDVVEGHRANIGDPYRINLGNRGIRSIERIGSNYFIIAGPSGKPSGSNSFVLYRWSGNREDEAVQVRDVSFEEIQPEALFEVSESNRLQILSDDGGAHVNNASCKSLPAVGRSFKSMTLEVSEKASVQR